MNFSRKLIWWWKKLQKLNLQVMDYQRKLLRLTMGLLKDTWRNYNKKQKKKRSISMKLNDYDSSLTIKIWSKTMNEEQCWKNVENQINDYFMIEKFKKLEKRKKSRKREYAILLVMNQQKMNWEKLNFQWKDYKEKFLTSKLHKIKWWRQWNNKDIKKKNKS